MKYLLTFCILLFALCIASPAQSWEVYNRSTAANSDLLDGLDSTAFTLQSSFTSYTSTAGTGNSFTNISVSDTAYIDRIIGGTTSTVSGTDSTVLGGTLSSATANYATTGGGYNNDAAGTYSFIGGGGSNNATATYSAICGGNDNTITGGYGAISGGFTNLIDGTASAIIGGGYHTVRGDYSVASGRGANFTNPADRTFAFVYSTGSINIDQANAFLIHGTAGYEKKVGIQTVTPAYTLDVNGDIGNTGSLLFSAHTTVFGDYSTGIGNYAIFANASGGALDMYLPDATTVEGFHVRFKKVDTSDNHVTVNAVGGQSINGNGTKVLEAAYNAIMLYSNGANWEVLQATSVSHYGEMHVHDNSTATTINTASIPHLMQGLFTEEDTEGFDFVAGSTGPISAFAEYSTVVVGTTKVTDVDHGLASGAILSISGTTSYNGVFEATYIDADNYYITDTFVADDGTGNWYEGDKIVNATGKSGKYKVEFHGFGTPETNNDILEFHVYKDAVEVTNLEAKGKFTSSTDVKPMSASGLVTIGDGEAITFGVINTSGTGDFTVEHVNTVIYSF